MGDKFRDSPVSTVLSAIRSFCFHAVWEERDAADAKERC